MSSPNFNHLKFRPVLNLAQIRHITDLVSLDDSYISQSIKKVMIPLIAKIEVGAISPAYKLSEIHAQKLADSSERQRYENDLMSPEEQSAYELKILGDI
jgi:predicted transcriptional regulator